MNILTVLKQDKEIRKKIKEIAFDQDEAIDIIVNTLVRAPYMVRVRTSPLAIFFILGPTFSGKKFVTIQMARLLKSGYKNFVMSEYALSGDAEKLCGSMVTPGAITIFLRKYPSSVIVFDEIDKAHSNVQSNLVRYLSEIDSGTNLEKCIVVLTTTLGKSLYQSRDFQDAVRKNPMTSETYLL